MENEINRMRRPSDSLLTSIFARTFSVRITPFVARTAITPMQVTLCGLLLGIIAAYLSTNAGWGYQLGAALFLELSHVLDCVDGELARLTGRGNPFAAAMDPITDRFKDIVILLAAFAYSSAVSPFGLKIETLAVLAILSTGLWLFYMYVVDAYLNPARKSRGPASAQQPRLYLGLYDLFIYGCIFFWLTNCFGYFLFYILFLATSGTLIQIYRLKNHLTSA
jgi:phosphatidylglycerophosphate synthase